MEQRYIRQEQEAERHLEAAKKYRRRAEAAFARAQWRWLRGLGADGCMQMVAYWQKRATEEEDAADEAEA